MQDDRIKIIARPACLDLVLLTTVFPRCAPSSVEPEKRKSNPLSTLNCSSFRKERTTKKITVENLKKKKDRKKTK